jgi:hypothetical protein
LETLLNQVRTTAGAITSAGRHVIMPVAGYPRLMQVLGIMNRLIFKLE